MRVTPLRSWARGLAVPQIVNISAFHRRPQTPNHGSGREKSGELNTLWTDTEREEGRVRLGLGRLERRRLVKKFPERTEVFGW